MKSIMIFCKNVTAALRRRIDSTHRGNQSEYVDYVAITAATGSRFCAGNPENTKSRLEKIDLGSPGNHRRQLYVAEIQTLSLKKVLPCYSVNQS